MYVTVGKRTHTYMHKYAQFTNIYTLRSIDTYKVQTYSCTCLHTYTFLHMLAYIHTFAHACIHTHFYTCLHT